nr:hypothetical protein [Crinivirus sp.]
MSEQEEVILVILKTDIGLSIFYLSKDSSFSGPIKIVDTEEEHTLFELIHSYPYLKLTW